MAIARQLLVSNTKQVVADSTVAGGLTVTINNPTGSAADVYLGGDLNEIPGPGQTVNTVTSTTGYLLKVGQTFGPIRLAGNEKVYAITNTATTTVYIFRSEGLGRA